MQCSPRDAYGDRHRSKGVTRGGPAGQRETQGALGANRRRQAGSPILGFGKASWESQAGGTA